MCFRSTSTIFDEFLSSIFNNNSNIILYIYGFVVNNGGSTHVL